MIIVQKKGDPLKLHGKLTAYVHVIHDSHAISRGNSPIHAMLESGWLVAQGNYRDQNSLKDFLQQELGTSLDDDEGLREFVEGLGGIEGALDPEKFREKLNQIEEMQEFIPTPAKMVLFKSEMDILAQEGDIFFLGEYSNPANANLAVNAMTILYQAQYRETQIHKVRYEIDEMIQGLGFDHPIPQLEKSSGKKYVEKVVEEITETIERQLMKRFIPALLLAVESGDNRDRAENDLRDFLTAYVHKNDVERIIDLTETNKLTATKNRLILLYCQKIDAVLEEQFDMLPRVVEEITMLETALDEGTLL